MQTLARAPVTVRIEDRKRLALDELAQRLGRDRSWVINEALDAYLALQDWQLGHVAEGLRQAESGEFASAAEVAAGFARWTGKPG